MERHVKPPRVLAVDEPWARRAHIVDRGWFEAGAYVAGCGAIVRGETTAARSVDVDRRCGANGCRSRWPALLRAVS